MQWAPATQSRLEKSEKKELERVVATRLASYLRVSISFLIAPPAPSMSEIELRFRAPKSTSKTEKEYLVEFARSVGEISDWLDSIHRMPPVRVPRFPAETDPKKAAARTRDSFGLTPDEPVGH